MNKKIIKIDSEKCIGCGICANVCKQSAIEIIEGKATVTRENHCDGIGNCLPVCPVNAISFSDKDIKMNTASNEQGNPHCISKLKQWPVQIKLVPENAPYFNQSHLLIAADCTAYAYANFHKNFMQNKVTLIGCPKLDAGDYTQKITDIISNNNIKSITVARMEVPCCGGIENATINALKSSEKFIPLQVITISVNGQIIE